jgi:DsbC/DsbD-like thiol-disulfide interchange protein
MLRIAAIERALSETLVAAAIVCVCAAEIGGQSVPASHGTVALIARDDVLEAGRVVSIGVLFDLQPGWHIYWVNPGDAGDPPRIQWELPAGFRAGDIRWPTPLRLTSGTLVDYGYEGLVLLPVPLHVPAGYEAGKPATLAADIRYVVCRQVCVPGRARLTLSLPPAGGIFTGLASTRALFGRVEARLPKPMPATWKVQVTEGRDQVVLTLRTGSQETTAEFFPLEPGQIDNAAAQGIAPMGRDGLRMTLRKSALLDRPMSVLRGLVVFGPDRVFEIAAPVSRVR